MIIAAIIPAVPEPTMPTEKLLLMRTKSPASIWCHHLRDVLGGHR
jgi:hypothetical protein